MEAMMRRTKTWLTALLTLGAVACGKSEAKKLSEVRSCSAITMDAKGAAQCLVLQYKWKQSEALAAATRFQNQQDSLAQSSADSAWRADAGKHVKEVKQCAADPSGEITRCLIAYGWAEPRAKATEDSVWRHETSRHREQVQACTRQRKMQAGACLQLYYKWSPERSLAVDDSIRRSQMKR
jgi:hypothetical protein